MMMVTPPVAFALIACAGALARPMQFESIMILAWFGHAPDVMTVNQNPDPREPSH